MSPHALIGQMSVGQMSIGQMSVGQMGVGQMGVGQVSRIQSDIVRFEIYIKYMSWKLIANPRVTQSYRLMDSKH